LPDEIRRNERVIAAYLGKATTDETSQTNEMKQPSE